MRISRVHIRNFRNFHKLDIALSDHAVVVGENRIGKSNLIYALRLILDPSLPDTARQLKDEDFWDGLPRPLKKPDVITISLDFTDFEDNTAYLAVLGEFLVSKKPMVSRLTYIFGPIPTAKDDAIKESDYEFFIYGADKPETRIGSEFRRRLPMDLLQALRDTESDIANWRRSPLRPMLDEVSSRIDREKLLALTKQISEATDAVTETPEISALAGLISDRLSDMVGSAHALEMDFGFSPTEPERLLRALRLFIDDGKRGIGEASLGSANLLYLALKTLELDQLVQKGQRDHTFLAIEEPEAHLHPHLQRMVYRDFLHRRTHQEAQPKAEAKHSATSVLMTTHSPHIVSVSPLNSLVLLRKTNGEESSEGVSTAQLKFSESERQDLERYLDVTRGEMLFARGILLVEGEAELFLLPILGKLNGYDFDEIGITVCSVAGTNFTPYVKLLGPHGLNLPFAVLTDRDPQPGGNNLGDARVQQLLGHLVDAKALAGKSPTELLKIAPTNGLFLNQHTLEVDLFEAGLQASMTTTLIELAESAAAKARAEAWRKDPKNYDKDRMLGDIAAIGKGRFAQRLASNIKDKTCPKYILSAFDYVATRCR